MRSIILLTLFLIPLFGFAFLPIQTTTPSDTIIESKKETIEEYKNRIDKQLYNKSKAQKKSISKIENIKDSFNRPLKSIGLNFLGDASIISINHEKLYLVGKSNILSTKLGLGYNQEFCISFYSGQCSPIEDYLTIPHHFTANIGKKRSFFEFGLGGTMISGKTNWPGGPYILYVIIGYRFLPLLSNKFNFRIYCQPPIPIGKVDNDFSLPDFIYIPLGLNIGISF